MKTINWKLRDTLALFVIPLEFLLGFLCARLFQGASPVVKSFVPFSLKLLSIIIIILLFHSLLAQDWHGFKKRLWLKLLICAAGAVAMNFILTGVRLLLNGSQQADVAQSAEAMNTLTGGLPFAVFLIAALAPVLAPLTEEVVFRHVLFYNFKDHAILRIVMFFVSAFLFGAIHFNNFGGNLFATIPYMIIACLYNLVYYFTKNIWFTITIHFMFNFAQSVIPAIQIPFIAARVASGS